VTLVTAPKNGGFAYGNNVALQHACAAGPPRYLHMLNPDTIVRNGAIGALFRFLETHREVGIAGSGLENPDGSQWQYAFRFPSALSELEEGLRFWLTSRWLRRWAVAWPMTSLAQAVDWVSGASMMIRWSVIDQIGGFDENYFLYFEETDFCWRARQCRRAASCTSPDRVQMSRRPRPHWSACRPTGSNRAVDILPSIMACATP
jgi:N-acetylglucosaminyl-diphospho-decaprenol L-rhamnosyltransferase